MALEYGHHLRGLDGAKVSPHPRVHRHHQIVLGAQLQHFIQEEIPERVQFGQLLLGTGPQFLEGGDRLGPVRHPEGA